MFCAKISFDLVTLIYGLLTLAMWGELSYAYPVHLPILSILQLSVRE